MLLENVRILEGEKKTIPGWPRASATLCDGLRRGCLGTAHRAEAAPTASPSRRRSPARDRCSPPSWTLSRARSAARSGRWSRWWAAAKVSAKLEVLESLIAKVDALVVGGGIANTFLAAAGFPVGKSLHEPDMVEVARRLLAQARAKGVALPIPTDVVVAREFAATARAETKAAAAVHADEMILDIGPVSAQAVAAIVAKAGTIIWNGPVGVFEFDAFGGGTKTLAEAIAHSPAFSIAGGGDTLAAIEKYGIERDISYISTGGGAFLEFVEGKTLPAVAALERRAAGG